MKKVRNEKGFTLFEIIAVLIILAIISALVISRGFSTKEVNLQVEVDTLKGHLRYAQNLAMNEVAPFKWGIQIGETSYTLVQEGPDAAGQLVTSSPLSLPNESSATHSFAPFAARPITVLFDSWGSPGNNPVTVTLGGMTINITPNTGFIP